jgi:hypothetical protein
MRPLADAVARRPQHAPPPGPHHPGRASRRRSAHAARYPQHGRTAGAPGRRPKLGGDAHREHPGRAAGHRSDIVLPHVRRSGDRSRDRVQCEGALGHRDQALPRQPRAQQRAQEIRDGRLRTVTIDIGISPRKSASVQRPAHTRVSVGDNEPMHSLRPAVRSAIANFLHRHMQ